MNRFQKRIIGITSALASLTFAMITAAVGTVAWFVASARQQVNGMSVETESPDLGISFDIYQYNERIQAGEKLSTPKNFRLPEFEKTFIASSDNSNEYANAIMRVDVEFVKPLVTVNDELRVEFECSTNYFDNSSGESVVKASSNVSQFKCLVKSYTLSDSTVVPVTNFDESDMTDEDRVYNSATTIFSQKDTSTTFVHHNANADKYSKTNKTANITPPFPSGVTITSAIFYIEFSYNVDLVNKYFSEHASETIETMRNSFDIDGDIEKVRFALRPATDGTSNTGRYVQVQSDYNLGDGKYLAVYEEENGGSYIEKAFNGSLATTESSGSTSDAYVANNNIDVKSFRSSAGESYKIPSIVSNNETDAAALTYDDDENTLITSGYRFDSENGTYSYSDSYKRYLGNTTNGSTTTIRSSTTNDLTNTLSIDSEGNGVIEATTNATHSKLLYNSASNQNRFGYSTSDTLKDIKLYKYQTNADSMGTLDHIDIITPPTKTEYIYDEVTDVLDLKGMVVRAYFTDGGYITVNNDSLGISFTKQLGSSVPVTVSYHAEADADATDVFYISIIEKAVSSISINTRPTKTIYYDGDSFALAGLKINVNYNNGDSTVISYPYTGLTSSIANGTQLTAQPSSGNTETRSVTITYAEKTTSFNITISKYFIEFDSDASETDLTVDEESSLYIKSSTMLIGASSVTFGVDSVYQGRVTTTRISNTEVKVSSTEVLSNVTIYAYVGTSSSYLARAQITVSFKEAFNGYQLVASELSDWSGEYVVGDYHSTTSYGLFNGLDATYNTVSNTVSDGKILSLSQGVVVLKIEKYSSGYSIKITDQNNNENHLNVNKYIYGTSGSNKLNFSDSAQLVNITWNSNLNAPIIESNNTLFFFNNTSGQYRYRFYNKSVSDIGDDYHLCYMFKKVVGKTTVSFNPKEAIIYKPANQNIEYNLPYILNQGTDSPVLSFTSSNSSVVSSITNNGVATVIGSGSTSIKALLNGVEKDEFNLTVGNITSISVLQRPTKTSYSVDEYFDPSGLSIQCNSNGSPVSTVIYSDSTKSLFTFNPSLGTKLKTTDTSVTIGLYGLTVSTSITVTSAATPETIDFSSKGYSNQQAISSVNGTNCTITFNKGSNKNNAPTYYTSGTAIRVYGGNYFTVTSTNNITEIKITFGTGDGSNAITTNCGNYNSGTWTGSAKSIKFTISGSSGNRRIRVLEITYG